jgi:hypothetical protein
MCVDEYEKETLSQLFLHVICIKKWKKKIPQFFIWDPTHLSVQPIEGHHVC